MKILYLILDGLGDDPTTTTPLELAHTPNMDLMAQRGLIGLHQPPCNNSTIPTSEESHLALFGYDTKKYQLKRGIISALGAEIKVKPGEISWRGNLALVDKNLNILDGRAGDFKGKEKLIKAIGTIKVQGVKFLVKNLEGYRVCIVMQGRGLSDQVSDNDGRYTFNQNKAVPIQALNQTASAIFTAKVINEFLKITHEILQNYPANYLLLRGASVPEQVPSFEKTQGLKSACVARASFYQGIAKALDMKVVPLKDSSENSEVRLKNQLEKSAKTLQKYDFVFCHIKETDSFSHSKNCLAKKEFIEKIDQNLKIFLTLKNIVILITGDHSTSCHTGEHIQSPSPFIIFLTNRSLYPSHPVKFSEKTCAKTGLLLPSQNLLQKIKGLI